LLASRPDVEPVTEASRGAGTKRKLLTRRRGTTLAPVQPAEHVSRMQKGFVGERLLTVGEVAGTMRVSNMTVYRLIKAGQLAAIRVGKNYRIRESDVNRYLSERSVRVEREGEE
jgi:excisionase family DNA binding protein